MWLRLCLEEVLSVLTRPAVYVAAAFLVGISLAAMVQNREELQEHRARYEEELQARLQAQLRVRAPNGRVVEPGFRVLRPPSATTILLPSSNAALPSGWDLGPAGIEERPPYPIAGNSPGAMSSFGLDSIVLIFGGLLSIGLGLYQVLTVRGSHWREALRALPVAWRSIVGGHLVAGAIVVSLVLTIWWLFITALVGMADPVSSSELRRTLFSLLLPVGLYLLTLNAAGVAAALWTASALKGITTALGLWLILSFVLPQGLGFISRTAGSGQSRHAMERERQESFADEIKRFEDDIGRMVAASAPTPEALAALVNIDDPPIQHLNLDAVWRAGIASARTAARRFDSEWTAQQELRHRLLGINAALSPATAMASALSEFAGVGETARTAWEEAATKHHEALVGLVFDDRPMLNSLVPIANSYASFGLVRHPPRPHSMLPVFQEPLLESRRTWRGVSVPVLWLLLQAILAVFLAYRAGIRDLGRDV